MSTNTKKCNKSKNCDININYVQDYKNLCMLIDNKKIENICQEAINGNLRSSKFRSLYWAVYLKILTKPSSAWTEQREQQRINYNELKLKFTSNPHIYKFEGDDNPLSQEETSLWNKHHQNMELLSIITQDVVRTFPGNDFFRKKEIQDLMTSILFVFARAHPHLVYMQGFHEVVAFVIFVVHCDQQAFLHVKAHSKITDASLFCLMSPEHLESDCYELFVQIMDKIGCYYQISDVKPLPTGHFPNFPEGITSKTLDIYKKPGGFEVIKQLETIKSKLLLKEDLHLHNHLLKHEIPLSLFGIRWLRLLFGREFPLDDLLTVWDVIFAVNDNFGLVNHICVSMLIRIRHKLLYSDYTSTLMYLMKYPPDVDVNLIIRHALHMYDAKTYERPEGLFVYIPHMNNHSKVELNRGNPGNSRMNLSTNQQRRSLKRSESYGLHVKTAKVTLNKASEIHKVDNSLLVLDGYVENDPEVFKLELQHKNNIMEFSRNKILEYVNILKTNLHHNSNDHVYNAIDGLEEICLLLQPNQGPDFSVQLPVEKAFEADENPIIYQNQPIPSSLSNSTTNFVRRQPVQAIQELKSLNKINNDVDIESLPKIDPTMERRDSI